MNVKDAKKWQENWKATHGSDSSNSGSQSGGSAPTTGGNAPPKPNSGSSGKSMTPAEAKKWQQDWIAYNNYQNQPKLEDFANANPYNNPAVSTLQLQRDKLAESPSYKLGDPRAVKGFNEIQNQITKALLPKVEVFDPKTGAFEAKGPGHFLQPLGETAQSHTQDVIQALIPGQEEAMKRGVNRQIDEWKQTQQKEAERQLVSDQADLDTLTKQRDDISKQMSDLEASLGSTVNPDQRAELNSQLDTLLSQYDALSEQIASKQQDVLTNQSARTVADVSKEASKANAEKRGNFWDMVGNANVAAITGQAGQTEESLDAANKAAQASVDWRESREAEKIAEDELKDIRDPYRLSDIQRTQYKARLAELEPAMQVMDTSYMSPDEYKQWLADVDEYQRLSAALANDSASGSESINKAVQSAGLGIAKGMTWLGGMLAGADTGGSQFAYVPDEIRQQNQEARDAVKEAMYEKSFELGEKQREKIGEGTQNRTSGEKLTFQAVQNTAELAADAIVNTLTGGGGLAFMGVRVFGGTASDAMAQGASEAQAVAYAALTTGVEVLTEKMFDGLYGVYGEGVADDMTKDIVMKLTENPTVAKLLTIAFAGAGESAEELASGMVSPLIDSILTGEVKYDADWLKETGDSILVAGLLGAMGGSLQVVGNHVQTANGTDVEIGSQEWRDAIVSKHILEQFEKQGISAEEVYSAIAEEQTRQLAQNILDAAGVKADVDVTPAVAPTPGVTSDVAETAKGTAEGTSSVTEANPAVDSLLEALDKRNDKGTVTNAATKAILSDQNLVDIFNSLAGPAAQITAENNAKNRATIRENADAVAAALTTESAAPGNAPANNPAASVLLGPEPSTTQPGVQPSTNTTASAATPSASDTSAQANKSAGNAIANPAADALLEILQNRRNADTNQISRKGIEAILADKVLTDLFNETAGTDITQQKNANNTAIIRENADAVVDALLKTTVGVPSETDSALFEGEIEETKESREETLHLKDQVRNNLNRINEIDNVSNVQSGMTFSIHNIQDAVNWITNKLGLPLKISREGFGEVSITRKRVNRGFGYLPKAKNEAVRNKLGQAYTTALLAVPDVIAHGIEIESHKDHKGYGHPTKTFAAPVLLDGKQGIVAVVVKQTTGNFYDVHSVLTPDGALMVLDGNNKTEALNGAMPDSGTKSPSMLSVDSNIAQPSTESNSNNNDDDNNPPSGPSSPGGTSAPGTVPAPTGLKRSQTESHTLQGNTNGGEQDSLFYVPVTEKQTMMAAAARVKQDISGEMSRLIDKESWDSADVDTAMTIYGILQADGVRNHDFSAAQAWGKVIQPRGTATAQALQAFSKWTRTGQAVFTDAITEINENSTLSEEQKNQVLSDLHGFADRFDTLTAVDENGNTTVDGKDLRQLILDLNKFRKTGTFNPKTFGKVLNQVQDTEWLQEFALRQLMAVSADYTNNPSLAKQLKTWQVNSQLSRLGTFFRNIGGNMTFGVQDTLAQDFFGYAIDSLVSKKTGRKEVGFDKGWMSSTARKAAADALYKSILEVSGDVDMTGEATRYGNTTNRTNKMTGNGFEQFMSRWEQLLGYSLTSSDRFSRGQIEASIAEGLMKANKGKMTQEQANEIAKQVADYRLFQNNGTTAQFSRKIHDALNTIGVKGQNGESFGLGDLINPYPGVPANLGVKALEYSPANIIKGGIELHKILSDYKHGVDVDYGRQNQAVMDMARGMSGVPAIALLATLFKRGVIKNADDEDDLDAKAQKTAEGQTGVQINLSAMKRTLEGKSSEWQSGDDLMSIGWLEPLNAFMAIASMVADSAEDETLWSMAKQYPQAYLTGSLQSILDMPVMSNLANMVDAYNYSNAEALGGKIGDMALQGAGDAISGMLPAPIGQFAKATDPMQRSTKGDSNFETVLNGIMANIPGLREQLDPKLDAYGNEREYSGTDTQRWLNTFVLPGAISEYSQNDIQKLTDDLYRATGDVAVFPDRKPPSSIKFGTESVKLSTEQQDAYQKKAGETIQDLVERTTHTSAWNTLTDEEKVSALDGIYKYAEYIAKKDFADANEYKMSDSMYSKYEKLDNPAEGIIWNNKWSEATANGEQDYVAMDKVISEMERMSDDVREMMENKDYVQKLEDASALGIGSRDFFITHDFLSGISKAEKEGTTLDYDAIDKGIQQYAKVVDSDEKADVFSSYFSKGDELAEAAKSGMKSEEWFKYYHKYKEISDLTKDEQGNNISANAKHDEFNNFVDMSDLSPEQKEMLKGQFTFFTGYTVDNTTYDKMVRGGADPEAAYRWVQEQGDLVPTGDHTSVTSNQKAFVILNDNSLDPADRIEAVLNTDGSVVKPNQGDMARWLSSNFSYSEAKYYWRKLQSKFGWSSKSTYEKALKK